MRVEGGGWRVEGGVGMMPGGHGYAQTMTCDEGLTVFLVPTGDDV